MAIYVVKPGDSIYSIAQRFGIPSQRIMSDNSITNAQNLIPGQSLNVKMDNIRHIIERGQSLYSLARDYGINVKSIQLANPNITDFTKIQPGQTIQIPMDEQQLRTIEVNGYAFQGTKATVLEKTFPYLTYISIFSYSVEANGDLIPIYENRVISAALQNNVAPWMVITNTKETGGFDSDLAHIVLTNEQVQTNVINNIVETMQEKQYLGINVDFEYVYNYDVESYNKFLQRLVDVMHPLGYTVSTALAPKLSADQKGILYEAHDYATQGRIVDRIILMTYEWGYTYGPPQAVSPIDQMEKVLQYATSVIPSRKILMGMPNYGYDWTLPFERGTSARSVTNQGAIDLARDVGATIEYDQKTQTPYFNYYDQQGKEHVVWFDDARSIKAKLELVNKYNLAGVSYWTIDTFFAPNWLILSSMYNVKKVI